MRRLLAAQLTVAVYTVLRLMGAWVAEAAAKTSATASWSPAEKQKSTLDITASSAHLGEMKVETTTLECRSFDAGTGGTAYTGTINFVFSLIVAGVSAGNIALRIPAAATVTGNAKIELTGTAASPANQIWVAAKLSNPLVINSTGTFRLEEALKTSNAVKVESTGKLETAGKTLEAARIEAAAGATLDVTNSLVKLSETATEAAWSATGTVTTTGSTIEVTDTGANQKTFAGSGKTFNTVNFPGFNVAVTGSNTFAALGVNNKGSAAEKGLKVTAGTTQTVTAVTSSGTSVSKGRLESATPGSRFAVKGPGVNMKTAGTLILKDVEYTGGGTWYVEGEGSEGTNTAGIVFGPEPAGKKTQEVEGLLTGQARTTAETVKSSPVTATLTTKGVLAASTVKIATASGTLTTRAGMTAAQKLVAVSTGRLSNLAALRSTTGGHVFAVEGTMTGNAAITGAAVRSLPAAGTIISRARMTATQKLVAASSASITAQPRPTATLRVTYRTTASLTARPVLAGVVESTVTTGHAVLITVRNYKQTEITVVNRKQVEIAVVNRKQAEIGVSNL